MVTETELLPNRQVAIMHVGTPFRSESLGTWKLPLAMVYGGLHPSVHEPTGASRCVHLMYGAVVEPCLKFEHAKDCANITRRPHKLCIVGGVEAVASATSALVV